MSTNYTENFDLCQWEPTDPVIRTDFNADNEKIDAALAALEEAKTRLDRVAVNMAYYTGRLVTLEKRTSEIAQPMRAMLNEPFLTSSGKTLTGGAVIQNKELILNGTNKTATMTDAGRLISEPNWTQARMWLHQDGGTVTPYINGNAMELVKSDYNRALNGEYYFEMEYLCDTGGTANVQVSLGLATGSDSSMRVLDYFVIFF